MFSEQHITLLRNFSLKLISCSRKMAHICSPDLCNGSSKAKFIHSGVKHCLLLIDQSRTSMTPDAVRSIGQLYMPRGITR